LGGGGGGALNLRGLKGFAFCSREDVGVGDVGQSAASSVEVSNVDRGSELKALESEEFVELAVATTFALSCGCPELHFCVFRKVGVLI